MLYSFFGRKSLGSAVTCAWTETSAMQDTQDKSAIKNKVMPNKSLAE